MNNLLRVWAKPIRYLGHAVRQTILPRCCKGCGNALSLPNMLVIRSVMGTKKTAVFVLLVVVMATTSGIIFGILVG